MDSAHLLDRERSYLSRTSFHEPFEPIDDPQDVRAAENTVDRGGADHTIDSGSRPATDENPDGLTLYCHQFSFLVIAHRPFDFFTIFGMVVYSISSRGKR